MVKLGLDRKFRNRLAGFRTCFMHLFRYSERLHNQLSPDDCCEGVCGDFARIKGDIDKAL